MAIFGQPQVIKDYQRLRKTGPGLIKKINAATLPIGIDPIKVAKKLTIPVEGRTIIFEDEETEGAAFMDFLLHESRHGGRRVIEHCDPDRMNLSPDERDLLEAHKVSRTSLFEVPACDSTTGRLTLRDLLEPERPDVLLSDLSLSSCPEVAGRVLLFIRVIECQGIQMTSGMFFSFSAVHRETLLAGYQSRMKTVSPSDRSERRMIFFFQQHRTHGAAQAFADVES